MCNHALFIQTKQNFSSLEFYKKIIPCGIKNKEITNLKLTKNQNYKKIKDEIVYNFIKNLEA